MGAVLGSKENTKLSVKKFGFCGRGRCGFNWVVMVPLSASCVLPAISAEDGGCHRPGQSGGSHWEGARDQGIVAYKPESQCDVSPLACFALVRRDHFERFRRVKAGLVGYRGDLGVGSLPFLPFLLFYFVALV